MNNKQKNLVLALAIGIFLLAIAQPVQAACGSLSACGTVDTVAQQGCYVLTQSITTTGTCFVANTSNVVLDCGGR